MTYKLTGTLISDEGYKRSNNEDNFSLFGTYRKNTEENKSRFSCITSTNGEYTAVYDGMGGEDAGEVASLIAAETIKGCSIEEVETVGLEQLQNANRAILSEAARLGTKRSGTTSVGLYFGGDIALCCNVGDSRCYLFRNGELTLLSKDHSEGQRLIDFGVDPMKVRETRAWHQLTQHLGIPEDEFVIEPAYSDKIKLQTGDVFLLCSDGLSDMVLDNQIAEILSKKKSEAAKAQALVDTALKNGGKDNTTVMLITVGEECDEEKKKETKILPEIEESFWDKFKGFFTK